MDLKRSGWDGRTFFDWLCVVGRGVGQVMFQNNAFSGLLMLAGIACSSWEMAVLALAGNLAGTLTAVVSGYADKDVDDGLYGYNGTLVGIAAGTFMEMNLVSILLLILGAALSSWAVRLFAFQRKLPALTAPFVLVSWLLIAVCRYWFPSLQLPPGAEPVAVSPDYVRAFCLNFGQVMLQGGSLLTGLLFLAALLANSRMNALYAVLGGAVPLLCGCFFGGYASLNAGLLGYNGVLCGIAVGSRSAGSVLRAVLAIVLATLLQIAGMEMGLVTLTAPFVLAVWCVSCLRSAKS